MTPNEFYALPPISVHAWHDFASVARDVLQINDWDEYDESPENADTGRVVIHEKLDIDYDGRRGVSAYAMYFDDQPFGLMFTGGRDHRDSRDAHVTDMKVWREARNHVLDLINRNAAFRDGLTAADEELYDGYYGAVIAKVDGETRLVTPSDLNPVTGAPVFDSKKFEEAFEKEIRPLGEKIGSASGLEDTRMLAAAVAAIRGSVIGR